MLVRATANSLEFRAHAPNYRQAATRGIQAQLRAQAKWRVEEPIRLDPAIPRG